jgi:hypothetical protein
MSKNKINNNNDHMSRSVYAASYSPTPARSNYRYVPIETKRYEEPVEKTVTPKVSKD